MDTVRPNTMELSQQYTITVKLRKMREWTWRVKATALLVRLACWISPFAVEIITDGDD